MSNNVEDKIDQLRERFKLSYKQANWCIHFSGNATEAAKIAQYKDPNMSGHENLGNPKLTKARAWLNRPQMQQVGLDRDGVITAFMDIATSDKSTNADKLRALENIAKISGIYAPDKKAILGHFSSESLDRLTDDELVGKIASSMALLEDLGVDIPGIEKVEEG